MSNFKNPSYHNPKRKWLWLGIIVLLIVISLIIVFAKQPESNEENNEKSSVSEPTVQEMTGTNPQAEEQHYILPADAISYNGHYYKLFEMSLSWSEAEEYCKGIGGHLVSVNSEQEQTFIESISQVSSKINIWIGGFKNGESWMWTDGSTFEYTNWDSYTGDDGEEYIKPDNYWGNENYIRYANYDLTFSSWIANKGKWDDAGNIADGNEGDAPLSSFGFICEWGAN